MSNELQRQDTLKSGRDMIYLAACALHGNAPSSEQIRSMDLPKVYEISKKHTMQAITWTAIELWFNENSEAADLFPEELQKKWSQSKAQAIRRSILYEAEREKLFSYMDEQKIWYMPLKGVILQDYYPSLGMRQMVDNDILFDSDRRETIRKYFLDSGYTEAEEPAEAHDVYQKKPFYNFEMHFFLYRPYRNHDRHEYYKNVKDRLIPAKGSHPMEYRFTDEDFYIYCTAHAYKHFINGGIGIRALMDVYVYLSALEEQLDWKYIEDECDKLGMKEYQQHARDIVKKIFVNSKKPLTEKEHRILDYYITSGAHGTQEQFIQQEIRTMSGETAEITLKGKIKYFLNRIFPDREYIARSYPFFDRHPLLIPFLIVYRAFRALILYPGKLLREFKLIWKTKK